MAFEKIYLDLDQNAHLILANISYFHSRQTCKIMYSTQPATPTLFGWNLAYALKVICVTELIQHFSYTHMYAEERQWTQVIISGAFSWTNIPIKQFMGKRGAYAGPVGHMWTSDSALVSWNLPLETLVRNNLCCLYRHLNQWWQSLNMSIYPVVRDMLICLCLQRDDSDPCMNIDTYLE